MSNGYLCDGCEEWKYGDAPIYLHGWRGCRSGILLPAGFIDTHFCSKRCFEIWVRKGIKDGDN